MGWKARKIRKVQEISPQITICVYGKSKLYFSNISLVGVESAPTFIIWGRKAPPHIINKGFKGKIPCYSQKAVYRYLFPRRTYQGLQHHEEGMGLKWRDCTLRQRHGAAGDIGL